MFTRFEIKVLQAYIKDDFVNDDPNGWRGSPPTWVKGFYQDAGITPQAFSGVMSSLMKKKIIFTDGIKFYLTEKGKETVEYLIQEGVLCE